MIAATLPIHRPAGAKLLVADRHGRVEHWVRVDVVRLFDPGDLVIANDAATLPASLTGTHESSGQPIEARLAACESLSLDRAGRFDAVLFGAGDYRTPTEHRSPPPTVGEGDRLALGPLRATVTRLLRSDARLVSLEFEGTTGQIWEGFARHGRPIQYAHVPAPLALWDTWTRIAGSPVAFEPPSAGFVLDWRTLAAMKARGVRFATITHAAGLSSTGDPELDALLPFDEPYRIPLVTAKVIGEARGRGARIVAIGTTVVRALEHAGRLGVVQPGEGTATQRIGATSVLQVVDAILSGTHEAGTSHYELLRAFADDRTLSRIDRELNAHGYRTHEFGDSMFLERSRLRH